MKLSQTVALGIVAAWAVASGCSIGPSPALDGKRPRPDTMAKEIKDESRALSSAQRALRDAVEKAAVKKPEVAPVQPRYNPLDDQMVSFSMVDEDLQVVLYALAQSVGMNLIIDPSLTNEKRLVTLNFHNVSASTVLDEMLHTFDLYYEIEGSVIRVKPFEERMFRLNFLDTNVETTFDVGGDVLGEGQTESATGLTGSFKLGGRGAKQGNPYDLLEQSVKGLLSNSGKYSLNRLSGSLYVKDTPAVVRSVARLINHLREMLARQILIEARIIEVSLSDDYAYGIDWSAVRDKSSAGTRYDSLAWSLGDGLVLRHVDQFLTIDATIDALRTFGDVKVVSNPTIRAKHGQPAMISVGTSFTYKKSVTTTLTDRDSSTDESTEVEVSTVFDGLILGVIPFIEESGKITLLINPITSDVDPDSLEAQPVTSTASDAISLPKVSIKEISTTIGLESGDVVILGGLIDKRRQTVTKGVPFLSAIPGLGYLFRNDSVKDETRELVIVLSVEMI
ncbi:MAG: pilus (MSHA type) biogenesis protein MshL [Deltaproteobacteria bacterium]|nr:pilus (MSHA type) biogenesis protein MshL [Deltaproteobacteria bacterium]